MRALIERGASCCVAEREANIPVLHRERASVVAMSRLSRALGRTRATTVAMNPPKKGHSP